MSIQTTRIPKLGHVYIARYDLTTFVPEHQTRFDQLTGVITEVIIPVTHASCYKEDLIMFLGYVFESDIIPGNSPYVEHLCLKLLLVKKSEIHYMRTTILLGGEDRMTSLKRSQHQFSFSFNPLK